MAHRDVHVTALETFLGPDGLGAVLAAGFPVVSADGLVVLSCEGFSLAPPRHAEVDVARLGLTYGRALTLTARLTVYVAPTRAPTEILDIREQDLYLGVVPLLTREGVWCIDGIRRAPRRRLSLAPGVHPTVVDERPARCMRPQHGAPLTLWRDRQGALRVRFDGKDHDGDLWLRALDPDPPTRSPLDGGDARVGLGRALHPTTPRSDEDARFEVIRALRLGARFSLGPMGIAQTAHALGVSAPPDPAGLPAALFASTVRALDTGTPLRASPHPLLLRGVEDLYARAARVGLGAVLADARRRLDRAVARTGGVGLLPCDLLHGRALARAWREGILGAHDAVHDRSALARAAQRDRVAVDAEAWDVLRDSAWARWITPTDDGLVDLSPDAPVNPLGGLDARDGDPRSTLSRVAPRANPTHLRRALPVEHADPLPEVPHEVARGLRRLGARRVSPHTGRVVGVSPGRLWISADGATTLVPLAPRGPERAEPARAAVRVGDRVVEGDVLRDGPGVIHDAISLGRNAWVRFDAALRAGHARVSEGAQRAWRVAVDHEVVAWVRDTRLGKEFVVRDPPGFTPSQRGALDDSGLARLGAAVRAGDVLVGVVTPAGAARRDDGALEEITAARCALAPADGVVVALDVLTRRGVERSARHEAMVASALADLDAERDERAALSPTGAPPSDDDDARWALTQGVDLPPGVVARITVTLREERPLRVGDRLADLFGHRWTVVVVEPGEAVRVTVRGRGEGVASHLLRLGDPPPSSRRRRPT